MTPMPFIASICGRVLSIEDEGPVQVLTGRPCIRQTHASLPVNCRLAGMSLEHNREPPQLSSHPTGQS
jgi:hypothetical protein